MQDPSNSALSDRYRPQLLEEQEELRATSEATIADRKPVELDQQSVGRLSRMDALQNQAMAAGTEARRAARGRALSAALGRIAAGEFGYCDRCGDFIGFARLDLDPAAVRCMSCAR
ncbi:TraR/DksA C4-type zinc finger protein [Pseudooceanicola sp.]|uniref:TraR/DksA family transcriptional regulator n=1 Tax=Pseudooceanicola sp. TaxID=1914328 RepID=UPI002628D791|nr:TraR/DksA C4-type zinc finger protein [Pseudooceanicola sp.]MDF1856744.1 TraR/DksA C4-type zinc finger protein [Pseudooceanicola sp.]